jgi:hypothetical protein
MRKIILSIIIFILSFISWVFAETAIKAEINKTKLTTDQTLTYKIIITSDESKLPALSVPEFEGFNLVSSVQSQSLSFKPNNVKTTFIYTFVLAPTAIGKFKIQPSQIRIKNQIFSTQTFEIEVMQGKRKMQVPLQKKPIQPPEIPESEEPQITL